MTPRPRAPLTRLLRRGLKEGKVTYQNAQSNLTSGQFSHGLLCKLAALFTRRLPFDDQRTLVAGDAPAHLERDSSASATSRVRSNTTLRALLGGSRLEEARQTVRWIGGLTISAARIDPPSTSCAIAALDTIE